MRRLLIAETIAVVLMVCVARSPVGMAAPRFQIRSAITYPENNMTLSGVVEIRGVASHSSAQWWYNVSYAPGPQATANSQWVTVAQVSNTPVDGVLATWDTTAVPDGVYVLALTVMGEGDPTPWQWFVTNLTVNNSQPPIAPTPEPEQATPLPMPTAVIGTTPTVVTIEQPPTATPRPTVEGSAAPEARAAGRAGAQFDVAMLRRGFCTGGQIVVMLFVLWGLYVLAKALIRWHLRQSGGPPSR